MSFNRYDRRTDTTQGDLVRSLRGAGVQVWVIGYPCDLLLRFWCTRHREHCWQPLEVKTAYGKKDPKPRVDARQEKQREFLLETQTPIATDFDSAWRELNMRHALGRVETSVKAIENLEPRLFRQPA